MVHDDDGNMKKRETGLLKVNLNCYDHLHFPRRSHTGWPIKSVSWVLSSCPVNPFNFIVIFLSQIARYGFTFDFNEVVMDGS